MQSHGLRIGRAIVLVAAVLGCRDEPITIAAESEPPSAAVEAPTFAEAVVDQAPRRLSSGEIEYPNELREAGVEGKVVLAGIVGVDGLIEEGSVEVMSSTHADFEQSAIQALRDSRFEPGVVDGEAVRVRVEVPIQFRLAK